MIVPYNRPYIAGNELRYISELLHSGNTIAGDGHYTKKVNEFIETTFSAKKALMTTSCTGALELATYLLRLKKKDEVILPSFTFVSTANPVLLAGAKIVFAEIDESTMNIDPDDIRRKITPNTRAIYPVHYGGVACKMDEITEIAQEHGLAVVEDSAHGVNARYKNRYLGTLGDFGCYSFHETKNYSCGEGGALLINTDDKKIIERAEVLREKGTDRSKFFRGEVDKYTWVDIGSSYLPSDILAAFLYAQLESLDTIQRKRLRIYNAYNKALKPYENSGSLRLPIVPGYAQHNAHLYYVLFNDASARDAVMQRLRARSILAIFHYLPLHSSPMGKKLGYKAGDLPVTESVSKRLLRLPMYAGMTNEEFAYVISALREAIEEEVV
ncbi:MAG TPA: dTDP-4-amino-4,6-dideoxygalactose transaminase [Methanocella sp.]|uniref:dTDP-4-amino-4,6-dideoxygalactose transaminase n=1 Tax=Methanocella sp. TaxID=2052833 RepID=UPI002D0F7795|nr:dTDP-4-amino-4,6-dideoxygalactose transaminase [Methanocella sp.]HTY91166.1 dTDP-4-amino-4,6-dideoxygalactose transaminase [Methanocella sp.]